MKLKYADIIRQSDVYKTLESNAAGGFISHAYILASPDQTALDILAALFLELLLGDKYSRRVNDGSAPDVYTLPLNRDKEKLLTEDIDFVTENAYITPTELDKKHFVFDFGETMNETAQNKLLKTLEEPPSSSRFIIKCKNLSKLKPTVLSRCRVLELKEFSYDEIKRELKNYYPDDKVEFAAAVSRGCIGFADRAVNDKESYRIYLDMLVMLANMKKSSDILPFAAKMAGLKDKLNLSIEYIELLLRDALMINVGNEELRCFPKTKEIDDIAANYSISAITAITPHIVRARRRLELNGNAASVCDELLFGLLEERAKNK